MPIIDCHLHINHFGRSMEETVAHLDATGIERAFFLPLETGEGGVTFKTEEALKAYEKYPKRVIPFCQADVRRDDVLKRIREYHKQGCRGVGEQKEHVRLDDPRLERVIALCDELNWPITLHFEEGPKGFNQGIADKLEAYLQRYRRVRIIGHAQSWWAHISADAPPPEKGGLYPQGPVKPGGLLDRLLAKYPNLYGDLSAGSGYNALARDEMFSASFLLRHRKKLLFGSDCPCRDGKGGGWPEKVCFANRLKQFLQRVIHDQEARDDIFYRNAERVLRGQLA